MVDIPGWIMAAVAILGLGGALYAWFAAQMSAMRSRLDDAIEDESKARLVLERDLANYKLFVAQNHVPVALLRETEERLIAALDKLATRVETMAARIESVVVEMAKARNS